MLDPKCHFPMSAVICACKWGPPPSSWSRSRAWRLTGLQEAAGCSRPLHRVNNSCTVRTRFPHSSSLPRSLLFWRWRANKQAPLSKARRKSQFTVCFLYRLNTVTFILIWLARPPLPMSSGSGGLQWIRSLLGCWITQPAGRVYEHMACALWLWAKLVLEGFSHSPGPK